MPGDNCSVLAVAQVEGPKEWEYGSYRRQKTMTTRNRLARRNYEDKRS